MAPDELLHCRVTAVPGGHRVTVTGEIDMQTAPQFADALLQFANGSVTIDLTNVTFLDSSGVNALADAHTQIARRNARLVVEGVNAHVRRVLEITGLDTILHLDRSRPDSPDTTIAPLRLGPVKHEL